MRTVRTVFERVLQQAGWVSQRSDMQARSWDSSARLLLPLSPLSPQHSAARLPAPSHSLELVCLAEEADELDVRHGGAQRLVERGQRGVRDVVVRRNLAQVRGLQRARLAVVLDQAVLVQLDGGAVRQVQPPVLRMRGEGGGLAQAADLQSRGHQPVQLPHARTQLLPAQRACAQAL